MAKYVTRKCPYCNYVFERFRADWIAFGDPRVKCKKCGKIVIFSNIKEWKVRKLPDRLWIIFRYYTFQNLIYVALALFVIFLIMAIVPSFWGQSYNDVFSDEYESIIWLTMSFIIYILVAIFRHINFMEEINESNERMDDPDYKRVMNEIENRINK